MAVVYVPLVEHGCSPGWSESFSDGPAGWAWYLHREHHSLGTVIECACGKTWVCIPHPAPNVLLPTWRRETRWERRRRRNRQDGVTLP